MTASLNPLASTFCWIFYTIFENVTRFWFKMVFESCSIFFLILKLALVLLTRYFVFVHYPTFFEILCCLLCKLSIHGLLIYYIFFQQLTQFLDKNHDFALYWCLMFILLYIHVHVYTCNFIFQTHPLFYIPQNKLCGNQEHTILLSEESVDRSSSRIPGRL